MMKDEDDELDTNPVLLFIFYPASEQEPETMSKIGLYHLLSQFTVIFVSYFLVFIHQVIVDLGDLLNSYIRAFITHLLADKAMPSAIYSGDAYFPGIESIYLLLDILIFRHGHGNGLVS